MPDPLSFDIFLHMGLEAIGGVILFLTYKHVCRKWWHRPAMWITLAFVFSYLTVWWVG